jgi:hypothetical protein
MIMCCPALPTLRCTEAILLISSGCSMQYVSCRCITGLQEGSTIKADSQAGDYVLVV